MNKNKALKSTVAALVMLFAAANENQAQGNKPGGFTPKTPVKTEVSKDTVVAVKSDTLRADFKNNSVDADTGTRKKRVITSDMPIYRKAQIYSANNNAIGIVVLVGNDMKHHADEKIARRIEQMCADSGVLARVFVDSRNADIGNTVYEAYIKDHLGNTRLTYTPLICNTCTTNCVIVQYEFEHVIDYYPFGKVLREYNPSPFDEERYLITGNERDAETEWDYRNARYYDAEIGRF